MVCCSVPTCFVASPPVTAAPAVAVVSRSAKHGAAGAPDAPSKRVPGGSDSAMVKQRGAAAVPSGESHRAVLVLLTYTNPHSHPHPHPHSRVRPPNPNRVLVVVLHTPGKAAVPATVAVAASTASPNTRASRRRQPQFSFDPAVVGSGTVFGSDASATPSRAFSSLLTPTRGTPGASFYSPLAYHNPGSHNMPMQLMAATTEFPAGFPAMLGSPVPSMMAGAGAGVARCRCVVVVVVAVFVCLFFSCSGAWSVRACADRRVSPRAWSRWAHSRSVHLCYQARVACVVAAAAFSPRSRSRRSPTCCCRRLVTAT